MQEHRRKGQLENMSSDLPIKHIKKSLESSERWRAKRQVRKELDEAGNMHRRGESYRGKRCVK